MDKSNEISFTRELVVNIEAGHLAKLVDENFDNDSIRILLCLIMSKRPSAELFELIRDELEYHESVRPVIK